MSLNRFKFIKRMIIFDDSTKRNDRWKTDKFSAFREVFEMFSKQCARNYSLDDFLPKDETLYPTQWSIGFKTYNKYKPTKYGLNFRSLESPRKACVYYTIPYCGKPELITDAYTGDTLTLVRRIARTKWLSFEGFQYIYGAISYLHSLS